MKESTPAEEGESRKCAQQIRVNDVFVEELVFGKSKRRCKVSCVPAITKKLYLPGKTRARFEALS